MNLLFENGAYELNRVYVDLDDTLSNSKGAVYDPGTIADPFPGAKEFMRNVKDLPGVDEVHVYSCRTSNWVHSVGRVAVNRRLIMEWLERHEIPYDGIFTGDGKPDGIAFVDNLGVSCQPEKNPGAYCLALVRVQQLARPR